MEALTDNHHDYQVGRIVKVCLTPDGGLEVARSLAAQITAALAEYPSTDLTYRETLTALVEFHPHALLDSLLVAKNRRRRPIRRMLDFHDTDALLRISDAIVLSWAEIAPAERYPLVGRLFNLFEADGRPGGIMLHVIEKSPDRAPVLEAMSLNLGPSGGSVDGLIALYDSRAQGMRSLFSHSEEDVRQWARTMAHELQASADMRRRMLRHCNETFE